MDGDGIGPLVHGVKKHCPHVFSEIVNVMLSNSILVMSTNTTEGKSLFCLLTCFVKTQFGEASVVSMVMPDSYAMCCHKSLKSCFCLQCFFCRCGALEMNVINAGKMVDKNGGNAVVSLGKCPFCLHDETWCA